MKGSGEDMISDEHYASPEIQRRIEELLNLWAQLLQEMEKKGKARNNNIKNKRSAFFVVEGEEVYVREQG